MLTLKKLNKEIANPLGVVLNKGVGYFYLTGNLMGFALESSIYAYAVNHLSFEQWKAEIERLVEDATVRKAQMDAEATPQGCS